MNDIFLNYYKSLKYFDFEIILFFKKNVVYFKFLKLRRVNIILNFFYEKRKIFLDKIIYYKNI